ncbi:MAG TPA: hypothetical protein VFV38_17875 [Ktedonobacteraceae bacterium]|nr:hypothetical protein [Ktedonobacteraceae bacterium]
MLDDILKDTQAYKELTQRGFMEGELKGKREGELLGKYEGELLGVRTSIVKYLQTRFPDTLLADVASERTAKIRNLEMLQRLFIQTITLPGPEEIHRVLEQLP